jgi:hypothetical protein
MEYNNLCQNFIIIIKIIKIILVNTIINMNENYEFA